MKLASSVTPSGLIESMRHNRIVVEKISEVADCRHYFWIRLSNFWEKILKAQYTNALPSHHELKGWAASYSNHEQALTVDDEWIPHRRAPQALSDATRCLSVWRWLRGLFPGNPAYLQGQLGYLLQVCMVSAFIHQLCHGGCIDSWLDFLPSAVVMSFGWWFGWIMNREVKTRFLCRAVETPMCSG